MSWTREKDWKWSEGLKVLGFFLILGRLWWQVLSSFCSWDVNSATLRFFIILTVACQQRNARNARNRWASNGCHWDTYFVWFSYAKHVLSWRGRCHCVCDSAIWHPLKLVKLARDLTRPNLHEVAEVSGNPLVSIKSRLVNYYNNLARIYLFLGGYKIHRGELDWKCHINSYQLGYVSWITPPKNPRFQVITRILHETFLRATGNPLCKINLHLLELGWEWSSLVKSRGGGPPISLLFFREIKNHRD